MKNIKNFNQFVNEELFGLSKEEKEKKKKKMSEKQKLIDRHNKEIADLESEENEELVKLFHSEKDINKKIDK
jgi:hypothetical protein